MQRYILLGMLLVALLVSVTTVRADSEPDTAPLPSPFAGDHDDHGVIPPTAGYEYDHAAQSGPAPLDTPAPSSSATPSSTPVPEPAAIDHIYEAGTVELTVWVCSDRTRDGRCSYREGVPDVPFVILDSLTGVVLWDDLTRTTDASGRRTVQLELRERTSISVDIPLLGLSKIAQQQQGGVIVVIPFNDAPKELP